jgi:hypothetical protein
MDFFVVLPVLGNLDHAYGLCHALACDGTELAAGAMVVKEHVAALEAGYAHAGHRIVLVAVAHKLELLLGVSQGESLYCQVLYPRV